MELAVGQKLELVRHTDNNVIENTKTIESIVGDQIKFVGIKKVFTIYISPKGFPRFNNGNTWYTTEPHVKQPTHFEKYGSTTTVDQF